MANNRRSLFVPLLPPMKPNTVTTTTGNSSPNVTVKVSPYGSTQNSGGGSGNNNDGNIVSKSIDSWNRLPPEAQQFIINKVGKLGNKMRNRNKSQSSDGSNSGYALSQAPNPTSVNLNSGIKPNAYATDYLDAELRVCSPLHMTGALIQFPTFAGSKLLTYFNTVIAFDLQTKAQANVGFGLNVSTTFSTSKILTAMNALIYALQIYYYHTSIITYHSDPSNKNAGMIALRALIDVNIIESLAQLQRRLADTPCPPNLLQYIRFMNSNYFSGPNQGSAMIKTTPLTVNVTTGAGLVSNTEILFALNSLSTNENNEVYSLLRRAVPQWKPIVLKDVPVNPIYNTQFLTIFSNLSFEVNASVGTFNEYPRATSDDTEIKYNSFTNDLDGLAFSSTSIFDGTNFRPGLVVPPAASGSNTGNTRYSYYISSDLVTKAFVASKNDNFLVRSRMDTYVTNEALTSIDAPHLYGANRLRGVSINTLNVSCLESIEYLMSLETIKKDINTANFKRR